jgi:biopolymer transport protein ExbD
MKLYTQHLSRSNGDEAEAGPMVEMNTTPLIDVMLVLLVMLIITIPVQLHSVNLNMPAGNPPPPTKEPVVVTIDTNRATQTKVEELKSVLSSHPGSTEVHVRLSQPGRSVLMKLEDSYRVNATEALFGDLKVILGPRCLAG